MEEEAKDELVFTLLESVSSVLLYIVILVGRKVAESAGKVLAPIACFLYRVSTAS